jgi:chromosome segregation ATPase
LQLDVRADDFERETMSRIDLVHKHGTLTDLVAAKDRIILQLLKERESLVTDRDNATALVSETAARCDSLRLQNDALRRDNDSLNAKSAQLENELSTAESNAQRLRKQLHKRGKAAEQLDGYDDSDLIPSDIGHWVK